MSAPERGLTYLELPTEQLTATTPAEFAQVLNRIMTAAGMKASAVAVKVGKKIPRSQAYSMVSPSRTTLPSKAEQVRDFLEACRLAPVQVAIVMDLWAKLDRQAQERNRRALELAHAIFQPKEGAVRARPPGYRAAADEPVTGATLPARPRRSARTPRLRSTPPEPVASYRSYVFVDLISGILGSEDRTRNAVRLLVPLVTGFVVVTAIFTTWALLQPSYIEIIAGIFVAGFLLPITSLLRIIVRGR